MPAVEEQGKEYQPSDLAKEACNARGIKLSTVTGERIRPIIEISVKGKKIIHKHTDNITLFTTEGVYAYNKETIS